MAEVASRELRNNTRSLLDRVAGGERITITVDGRAVAELRSLTTRPRWLPRERFVHDVLANQADPGLSADLAALSDETTDDLDWP